jgi:hypothetical protein
VNVPPSIGMVISSAPDKATALASLENMGIEDLCDILEVISVDAHNRRLLAKRNARK